MIKFLANIARSLIGTGLSFWPSLQAIKKNGLTIFLFHSVNTNPGLFESSQHLSVTPELFKWQIKWILNRYQPISPKDIEKGEKLPPNACLITFDDGWAGVFEHAYPLLEKLSVPSLLFVNMDPIENLAPLWAAVAFWLAENTPRLNEWIRSRSKNLSSNHPALNLTPDLLKQWEIENGNLDWKAIEAYQGKLASLQQMKEWDGHPFVFYGNHLYNHWNATTMSNEDLQKAFLKNQEAINRFSSGTHHFAFTFGTFLPHQVDLLIHWGATHIYMSQSRVNSTHRKLRTLGRVNLSSWHDRPSRLQWEINQDFFKKALGRNLYDKLRVFRKTLNP